MPVTPPAPIDDSGSTADAEFDDLTGPMAPDDRPRGRRRIGTIAAVATCVFIVAMWAFVYIWGAVQKPVDKLSDPGFGQRAEQVCAVTATQLAALPPANESKTNVARAQVVTESNEALRQMLAKLRDVAPTSGQDGVMVGKWLSDYSTPGRQPRGLRPTSGHRPRGSLLREPEEPGRADQPAHRQLRHRQRHALLRGSRRPVLTPDDRPSRGENGGAGAAPGS